MSGESCEADTEVGISTEGELTSVGDIDTDVGVALLAAAVCPTLISGELLTDVV
jgi:hypothetical protein